MTIAKRKLPIYEVECTKCKSKIQFRKANISFSTYIICPACGKTIWADMTSLSGMRRVSDG